MANGRVSRPGFAPPMGAVKTPAMLHGTPKLNTIKPRTSTTVGTKPGGRSIKKL